VLLERRRDGPRGRLPIAPTDRTSKRLAGDREQLRLLVGAERNRSHLARVLGS
jgi:hypothetical protein